MVFVMPALFGCPANVPSGATVQRLGFLFVSGRAAGAEPRSLGSRRPVTVWGGEACNGGVAPAGPVPCGGPRHVWPKGGYSAGDGSVHPFDAAIKKHNLEIATKTFCLPGPRSPSQRCTKHKLGVAHSCSRVRIHPPRAAAKSRLFTIPPTGGLTERSEQEV